VQEEIVGLRVVLAALYSRLVQTCTDQLMWKEEGDQRRTGENFYFLSINFLQVEIDRKSILDVSALIQ